jgi:ADP-heptose:LPS heptosyltransferase
MRSRFLQVLLFNHSWRNVQKLNVRKWLLTTFKWNTLPQIHVVDRYLKAAGLASSGTNPLTLNVPEGVRLPTDKPYIAWVLGAKFKTKQFPIVKIMELLPSIKYPIVFLGGTSEVDESKKLPANHSIFNWVNKTTLDEAAFVLKNASMVVSNDTGLMHLAAFFNKPMLVLWGSTSEAFGMGPYRCARVVHAEIQSLSCRPCSKIGYKQCPKGHFKCMMLHPSQRLASQINSLFLEGTEAPR